MYPLSSNVLDGTSQKRLRVLRRPQFELKGSKPVSSRIPEMGSTSCSAADHGKEKRKGAGRNSGRSFDSFVALALNLDRNDQISTERCVSAWDGCDGLWRGGCT